MKCTCSMQSPLTSAKMTKSINLCSYALQPKPGFMRHQSYIGHLSNETVWRHPTELSMCAAIETKKINHSPAILAKL